MSVTPSDVGSRHRRGWVAASCVLAAAMACSFPDVTFAPADAGSPVSPAPPGDDDAVAPDQPVDSSLMARAADADDDAPPFSPGDETIDVSAASVGEETSSSPAPFDAADERLHDGAPETGSTDAVDSPASDAPPSVPPCPAACSGGCGSAGATCTNPDQPGHDGTGQLPSRPRVRSALHRNQRVCWHDQLRPRLPMHSGVQRPRGLLSEPDQRQRSLLSLRAVHCERSRGLQFRDVLGHVQPAVRRRLWRLVLELCERPVVPMKRLRT